MVPGRVIDELAQEYAYRPVVFVEQNAWAPLGERQSRFYAACTASCYDTPQVMVSSGHQWASGEVDYRAEYSRMVEEELARPPQAEIEAHYVRVGQRIRADIRIKNLSGDILSPEKEATVHFIVYEDKHVGQTGRIVRAAPWMEITTDLMPGATMTFTLETPDLSGVDWAKLHGVALVDYRPGGESGPYDMLQAVFASPITHRVYLPFAQR